MILLDTNVLIAPPAVWPDGEVLGLSIISLAELQFGIRSSATEEIRRNRVHRLAVWREPMDWILFDDHAGSRIHPVPGPSTGTEAIAWTLCASGAKHFDGQRLVSS